jgi:putative ABC transport system permease protein
VRQLRAAWREVWASARALRGFSLTFAAVGFAVIAGLTLTVGQGSAQRDAVIDSFAEPSLRTFILVDEAEGGALPWSMPARAQALSTVEAAWASGPAVDVRNAAFPHSDPVAARAVSGPLQQLPLALRTGRWPDDATEAIIDARSVPAAALGDGIGAVSTAQGRTWAVVGVYDPGHARAPTGVLYPMEPGPAPPRSLHVTVTDIRSVDAAVTAVVGMSDSVRPGELRVDRQGSVAQLRESVTGAVNEHASAIVLSVMLGGAAVLGLTSLLMVNARRQEFGRRRALGATRLMIAGLVVAQGFLVISTGAVLGGAAATGYLWLRESVLVPFDFTVWTVLAASLAGVAVQLPSAVTAGLRDPVRVLRRP